MARMGAEEIRGGSEHPLRGPRWLAVLLMVALGALVLRALTDRAGSEADAPAPRPRPSPSATAATTAVVNAVTVRQVCEPATDGRTTLDVTFVIENVTTRLLVIDAVTPLLPLDGLRAGGVDYAAGTCERPRPLTGGRVMPPDGGLLVTFHFGLPDTCPQPLPVQATVTVSSTGGFVRDRVSVLNDLGAVAFDTCPTPRL
jgi:hypothetical protein